MEFWLHTVLVLAVSTAAVMGFPGGASSDACNNGLLPNHPSPPNMAPDDFPFFVNTSDIGGYYMPGETYTIVLAGTPANMDFRGFLIQARIVADGSPVGQFMTDGSSDQQPRCTGNTAATHTLNNEKTMVELTWTAPMEGTGAILFRFTFVDRYSSSNNLNVFFAGLETDMISEASTPNATVVVPTATATTSTTTVTAPTATATVTAPTATATVTAPTATPNATVTANATVSVPTATTPNATVPVPTATTPNATVTTSSPATVTVPTPTAIETTPTPTPDGDDNGSTGLIAGTVLILLLSAIITLIN